jgi:ABC-type uncharacterized transport system permease subunit
VELEASLIPDLLGPTHMLLGVSILCFAASYAVAFVLEITRFLSQSRIRRVIMLGFAGAGLFAHTVYLANRAAEAVGSPLSSKQEWYLIAAWILVVVYLYLMSIHAEKAFGVFILPLVLGLIGIGALLADAAPFAREPASQIWGTIHGASVLLATVAVLVGFAAGLMYLGQAYRLKRKLPPLRGLPLPSLEWLQRANSRAVVISMIMLGIGILSGVILNLINTRSHAPRVPWNDPFVVSTVLMFGWLLLSSVIGLIYRPAREGHKVAYLTVVSFLFLILALGIGLFVNTRHGGSPAQLGRPQGHALGTPDADGHSRWLAAQSPLPRRSPNP